MTNERARATETPMSRRKLLTAVPASAVGLALSRPASASVDPAILQVIQEMEKSEGWETSSVVAAKAYAAYRMREALGLDLPDSKYARLHLEYQSQSFEDYRRSYWYEQDMLEGKVMAPPRPSSALDL